MSEAPPNGGVRSLTEPDPATSAGISFYHLTTTPLERALPKLLEKITAGGFKTVVVAESDERVEQLNQLLWTYDPNSFLAHGSARDGHAEKQPIFLSTKAEAMNQANVLLITNGMTPAHMDGFERILDMFDGRDAGAVENARGRWMHYKNAGHSVAYLKQTEQGGWEQKAAA